MNEILLNSVLTPVIYDDDLNNEFFNEFFLHIKLCIIGRKNEYFYSYNKNKDDFLNNKTKYLFNIFCRDVIDDRNLIKRVYKTHKNIFKDFFNDCLITVIKQYYDELSSADTDIDTDTEE